LKKYYKGWFKGSSGGTGVGSSSKRNSHLSSIYLYQKKRDKGAFKSLTSSDIDGLLDLPIAKQSNL
jgi:hypothetical protein